MDGGEGEEMTTFEWISLIGVLLTGFWVLAQKLNAIEKALVGKVSYHDCSEKRDKCPCVRELHELRERIEK